MLGMSAETISQIFLAIIGVATGINTWVSERSRKSSESALRILGANLKADIEDSLLGFMSELANLRIKSVTLVTQKEKLHLLGDTAKLLENSMRAISIADDFSGSARRKTGRFWRMYKNYLDTISKQEHRSERTNGPLDALIDYSKVVYEHLFGKMEEVVNEEWSKMKSDDQYQVQFTLASQRQLKHDPLRP